VYFPRADFHQLVIDGDNQTKRLAIMRDSDNTTGLADKRFDAFAVSVFVNSNCRANQYRCHC
jgi:hypothetical protein